MNCILWLLGKQYQMNSTLLNMDVTGYKRFTTLLFCLQNGERILCSYCYFHLCDKKDDYFL